MNSHEAAQQNFIDHLTELRRRLIYSLIVIGLGTLCAWGFSHQLFEIIKTPITPYLRGTNGGLVFTGVMDDFMAHIKIAIWSGVILTCPLWLYQLWKFVAPGLYGNEKRYALGFIFSGSFLFIAGVSFAYFVVYPMAFKFLLNFSGSVPMITISEYLGFFFTTSLLFGAAFELPLAMTLLSFFGLIDKQMLVKHRRYAIVSLAAISAIVAPPDLISMVLMLVPMLVLFELGVIMVGVFHNRATAQSQSV